MGIGLLDLIRKDLTLWQLSVSDGVRRGNIAFVAASVHIGLLQQLKPIKLARSLIERDSRITAAGSVG